MSQFGDYMRRYAATWMTSSGKQLQKRNRGSLVDTKVAARRFHDKRVKHRLLVQNIPRAIDGIPKTSSNSLQQSCLP
jgi:hypothetical protein